MQNNPAFIELSPKEKWEFIGKLVIAGQNDFFSECAEIVNRAEKEGLYERVKVLPERESEGEQTNNY